MFIIRMELLSRNFFFKLFYPILHNYNLFHTNRRKCNQEMVELLPLELTEDITLVGDLLKEFQAKTGSTIAGRILAEWPGSARRFVKVFPLEYQRALKQMAEDAAAEDEMDTTADKIEPIKAPESGCGVKDIEDIEAVPDKVRGFIKYPREKGMYRDAGKRQEDWDEIYNFKGVRKNLQTQAAR